MDKNLPSLTEVLGWIAAWALVAALALTAMHFDFL